MGVPDSTMELTAQLRASWRSVLVAALRRLGCLLVAVLACRLAAAVSIQLGVGLGLALAIAVPGLAAAQLGGLRDRLSAAETVAVLPLTALAAWAVPLAGAFALHVPFDWLLVVVLAGSALCLRWDVTALVRGARSQGEVALVCAGGAVLAVVASRWQPLLGGDALFHAGVVRKLLALPGLSLGGVSPYLHGHPHAGYAFPLLHAVQAAAVRLAGGDPSVAYQNLTPVFAFLVVTAVYGAGRALGGPAVGALSAALAGWDAATRIYLGLIFEPPFFTFAVLFPAAIVVLAGLHREPRSLVWRVWAVVAAAEVALIHPTYSIALAPLVVAVLVLAPRAWPAAVGALAATAAVAGWVYLVALSGGEQRTVFAGTPNQFVVLHGHSISSSGQALLAHRVELLPALIGMLVILARRRSPGLLAAAMLACTLVLVAFPGAGVLTTAAIGGGQAERLWNALPWMFVTAVVVVAAGRRLRSPGRLALAAAALAVGSVLLEHAGFLWGMGGPRSSIPGEVLHPLVSVFTLPDLAVAATALAAAGLLVWRLVGRVDNRPLPLGGIRPVAAVVLLVALMAGPVARDGTRVRLTIEHTAAVSPASNEATPGLIAFLRSRARTPFPVVLAPFAEPNDGIAYQLVGQATVYTVAISQAHSRATPRDDPERRRTDVNTFLDPRTTEAAREQLLNRYDVDYVVFDVRTGSPAVLASLRADPGLDVVYSDPPGAAPNYGRFVVFQRRTGR